MVLFSALGSVQAQTIAFFADAACVQMSADCGSEGYTLQQDLLACGYTVNTFTGTDAGSWSAALAGADALVIPETPECVSTIVLGAGVRAVIESFVNGGGELLHVIGGAEDEAANFLNLTFGFALSGEGGDFTANITGAAAGTPFAGGPASLPPMNDGDAVSNLPPGALSIYSGGGYSQVALIPYGTGHVVTLGWDWYQCDDPASEQDAWRDVLCRSGAVANICVVADEPLIGRDEEVICDGDEVRLFIYDSELNESDDWYWYDNDDCAGTPIGIGEEIFVSPSSTTTYYASGKGGCGSGDCSDGATITVIELETPEIYNVTGGTMNTTCDNNNTGLVVGLDGSELNVTYELYFNGLSTGLTTP
ncbi:MAG: hypothetical protein KDC30_06215, partial [Saprospiraceae bacterium]|nr:hypothetical protein [Saprospiraceae bacterium]